MERMQPPSFSSLLLAAAALSTFSSSSFASYVEPEEAPSAFHKRSAEPEPEAEALPSEDFKYGFLESDNNNLSDYYNALRRVSEAHSSKFSKEFSFGHTPARRSAEPEPEAEAEPIGRSLFSNYYFPGRGWQDAIGTGFFNISIGLFNISIGTGVFNISKSPE